MTSPPNLREPSNGNKSKKAKNPENIGVFVLLCIPGNDIKKNMEKVCAEMGLSMTAAFTIFAKTVVRERRIPFEVSADPFILRAI
jgi:hypothetical protein